MTDWTRTTTAQPPTSGPYLVACPYLSHAIIGYWDAKGEYWHGVDGGLGYLVAWWRELPGLPDGEGEEGEGGAG